ncbi:unnamed protein product [Auanema sp. JU1783]|nr:unnamed protein product [Auanema sp. JU1783]
MPAGGDVENSYLPPVWNDDAAMVGYMAMIKARHVNPIDHDRKVKFWEEAIDSYCIHQKNAVFTLDTLKRAFRRGDQIPASLGIVIEHAKSHGTLVTLNDWKEKHSTWVNWGVSQLSKTSSWIFGSGDSMQNSKIVHIPTLKRQSEEAMNLFIDEFKSQCDGTGEVIAYSEFYEKARHIFRTKENFDILLEYMSDTGDVTVGQSSKGERIIKFRDIGSNDPVQFTEADASVHDIRRAMTKVEREISVLEDKAKKYEDECRKALRAGEKSRAASFLRQKKRITKDISDKDGQLQGLLNMLHQLASTKFNKEVLDAYKIGSQAFKANLARHGLSPDQVDKTMDDISSTLEDYKELEDAMSQGFGFRTSDKDDDLQKELDALMNDEKKAEEPLGLPEVPSGRFGLREDDQEFSVEERSLEERLKKLRG